MSTPANALTPWTLLWLRPGPGLSRLRRQLHRQGGRLLTLCPWRIVLHPAIHSREQLVQALQSDRIIFTSPAAVRASAALLPLAQWEGKGIVMAVGAGTATALSQAGMSSVLAPTRMDSEGLLGLAPLQEVDGVSIGLITAPDGRGVIPATLRDRGAVLHVAEVYERRMHHLPARQRARLKHMPHPAWLAVGSGKALEQLWLQLSSDQRHALMRARVIPASERLAAQARDRGLPVGTTARSAMVDDLLAAVNQERNLPHP